MPHWIKDYEQPFTLIIQRTKIEGQVELDLTDGDHSDEVIAEGYVYRSIATNRDTLSDSDLIHFYNQRAEDSENRIKELKLDFYAPGLPALRSICTSCTLVEMSCRVLTLKLMHFIFYPRA